MMETPQNGTATKEILDLGVSRSGRVRKKSSKLLDFQSPDELDKKPKRIKQGRVGRPSALTATQLKLRKTSDGDELAETADEDFHDDDEAEDEEKTLSRPLVAMAAPALHDSEDELDELVADLVEGVEAEALEEEALELDGNQTESKVRQSLYMTEKSNKKKFLKDGRVITGKVERKDKGKARFTAYSLWAREFRKTSKFSKNQDLDFSNAARRLGELWANVSNKEKSAWRRKAKIQATKAKARERQPPSGSNAKVAKKESFLNRATTNRTRKLAAAEEQRKEASPPVVTRKSESKSQPVASPVNRRNKRNNNTQKSPSNGGATSPSEEPKTSRKPPTPTPAPTAPTTTTITTSGSGNSSARQSSPPALAAVTHTPNHKAPNIDPIDAAAHLKLLGESLSIIGERLKEHEGQIAVSGSLSVLLDSLLCSLGPLLCLTTHIPGLERKPQLSANLASTLDNIAYVMPGL